MAGEPWTQEELKIVDDTTLTVPQAVKLLPNRTESSIYQIRRRRGVNNPGLGLFHGRAGMYSTGCRCGLCMLGERNRSREYRKNNREDIREYFRGYNQRNRVRQREYGRKHYYKDVSRSREKARKATLDHQHRLSPEQRRDANRRAKLKKDQATRSQPGLRYRVAWTPEEDQVILEHSDLPLMELSFMLKRSYRSVGERRRKVVRRGPVPIQDPAL